MKGIHKRSISKHANKLIATLLITISITSTLSVTTRASNDPWFDVNWHYRKALTIDHTKVAGPLANFPVLVSLIDSDLSAKAQPDGDDIVFTDTSGARLKHEIETYYSANGTLIAWVKIPTLTSTTDTHFYIYYGNPQAGNQQTPTEVWDASYLAVHHLAETSGNAPDSTSNGNNGAPTGNVTQISPGKIGDADYFNGGRLLLPQLYSTQTQFTYEAWINYQSTARYFLCQWDVYHGAFVQVGTDQAHLEGLVDNRTCTAGTSSNIWYHIVFTYDGTTARLYRNATLAGSITAPILTWPAVAMSIGDRPSGGRPFKGTIDEVRFSSIARNSSWITTEFNNEKQPGQFLTVGAEESQNLPQNPIVSNPNPQDGVANIPITLTTLSASITSGTPFNWTITTSPNIGSNSGTQATNGTKTCTVSNLAYATIYTWTVTATNAIGTTIASFSFTTQQQPGGGSWAYMENITINHGKVTGNLANFPVLISITDPDLEAHAQNDGDDIYFASTTGTRYPHDLEFYNGSNGNLIAWVNLPSLSSSNDVRFRMYYGNPTCGPQENPTAVWPADYLGIYHLADTSSTIHDSTSNHNDGTSSGAIPYPGMIDGGFYFDGVNDKITLPQLYSTQTSFTFSAWVYAQKKSGDIVSQWHASPTMQGALMQISSAGDHIDAAIDGQSKTIVSSLNATYYFVFTYNGATGYVYSNGVSVSRTFTPPTWPGENLYIGARNGNSYFFKGIIDEVRFSNSFKNNSWVTTEYNNVHQPSTFETVGLEQELHARPRITNETPIDESLNMPLTLSELAFTLRSPAGERMNYSIYTTPDIIGGLHSGSNILNNTRIHISIVSVLQYSSYYTWTVQANCSGFGTTETFGFTTQAPTQGSWQYVKRIRVNYTKVAGNLINFPVLIHITDSDLAAKAQANGNDIYFGSATNVRYFHEIETFKHSTGELIAWVNVPALSSSVYTDIYMFYGNPICGPQQNPHGTWTANNSNYERTTDFLAVHHFAETSGKALDSSAFSNDGTPYGNLTQQIAGKIGDADGFDGIDDQIRLPEIYYNKTMFTWEGWIYPQNQSGARTILSQSNTTSGCWLGIPSTGDRIQVWINGQSYYKTGLTLNSWSYVVWTYANHTSKIYLNGGTPTISQYSGNLDWANERFYIGDRSLGGRPYKGILDDVRLSYVARSQAWITTEYNNMANPATFYSVNAEQAASTIMYSDVWPRNQEANYNATLSLYVETHGQLVTLKFRSNATGSWQTLDTYHGGTGIYQYTTNWQTKNKRYYWSVNVSYSQGWHNETFNFIAKPLGIRWRSNIGNDGATTGPLSADVNGDGYDELFFVKAYELACFDEKTGAPLWLYQSGYINYHSQIEIGDLNNDGIPEIVCSAGTHTIALHANNGTVYWDVEHASSNKNIVIADIDGNHYPYVYICSDDVEHGSTGSGRLMKLKGTTGEELKEVWVWRPCYGSLSFADNDNDGKFEIYMTDRAYDYVPAGSSPPSYGKGMQAYDAETLRLLWYCDKITCSSQCMNLVDVNGDGILDAVGCNENNNYSGLYIINGATWDKMQWSANISGFSAHSTCAVYDIDGDGRPELISASNAKAKIIDLVKFKNSPPGIDTTLQPYLFYEPPKMANVIGDSNLEIIGVTLSPGAIIAIYNNNYQLLETMAPPILSCPIVQDIDKDGLNEMVGNSADGSVRVYDTAAYASPTRPRSETGYYSERRLATAVYIPPPGAPQPIVKKVAPANNAVDVPTNSTPLHAWIVDYQYDLMNITISTNASGSWQTLNSYTMVGNGWRNITTSAFTQMNHRYYWRVSARDPLGDNILTQQTYSFITTDIPHIQSVSVTPQTIHPTTLVNISSYITDNNKFNVVKVAVQYPDSHVENFTALNRTIWTGLKYDDFEIGPGDYTVGGGDCAWVNQYAHHGTHSMAIRDFKDIASSFYLTQGIAGLANHYDKLRVTFWFRNLSMECRENFWVKYWDGTHWVIAADYVSGTDFTQPTFYYKTVYINSSDYPFHNNMKIRFQCDAGDDTDLIYVDQVNISAATNPDHFYLRKTFAAIGTYHYSVWAQDLAGNSVRSAVGTFTVT